MLSPVRLSTLPITLVHPIQAVEIFGNISTVLRLLVPWPSIDIHRKFYGDGPRGNPSTGELNTRGVAKYSDFGPIEAYIPKITNKKSYMRFRLVGLPKLVT